MYTVVYTDETCVHTSHAVPKCWQDSTTGRKILFSKGNLRIVELHDPWVCTLITIWVRPLVRSLAVPDNVHSSWPHSIFWSHFACICHSLTTGMLNHLANIQRWPCILLSVDFTLHKKIYSLVLNILYFYIFRRYSYPTHEKIILLSYIKIMKHQYMQ